ncbi:MAG: bacillithiol biosynthesis deacetylase BshB1 [Candidatus Bipolaricaulaceae bacterium]
MDVLVVGAHPDDAEIGLGGTIARWAGSGVAVGIVDLTDGEPTPRGDRQTRLGEAQAAGQVLGVRERICLDLPNRRLRDTVAARTKLAEVFREHRPRAVFSLLGRDQHPDHLAAADIVLAARFYAKLTKVRMRGDPYYPPRLFHYSTSHLRKVLSPAAVVDISTVFEQKLAAVLTYRSQFGWREEELRENLWVNARFYGARIGARFGEPIFSPEELPVWDPVALVGP